MNLVALNAITAPLDGTPTDPVEHWKTEAEKYKTQAQVNKTTVDEQRITIRELTSRVAILTVRLDRKQTQIAFPAAFTAAVVEWLEEDAAYLVSEIEPDAPIRLDTLIDEMRSELNDAKRRALVHRWGKVVAAAACARVFPRQVCGGCREADCDGSPHGYKTDIVVPARIRNLLGEAKNG